MEAEPGAMGHVAAPEPTSIGRRGPELRNKLSREVRSGAVGHMAAPELTSAGRCDPKLQLAW
jgi:hypothetical protein